MPWRNKGSNGISERGRVPDLCIKRLGQRQALTDCVYTRSAREPNGRTGHLSVTSEFLGNPVEEQLATIRLDAEAYGLAWKYATSEACE